MNKPIRDLLSTWAVVLLLTTAFWVPVALAQTAQINSQPQSSNVETRPGELTEIIVTATKRSEKALDIPVSLSVISADDIAAHGFTNYNDFLNTVPGVYVEDQGPGQAQIHIRGLVSQSSSGFPVATYFGETVTSALTNSGGMANLSLVDIERVEVLRGPQGTLFGADSLAGVVRTIPAAPKLDQFEASVDTRGFATAHSGEGSYHAEGMLNLPLINDQLAIRLVGYKDSIAGYIDNVVPARAPIDYSSSLGAPPGTLVIPGNPAFTQKDINSQDTWGVRVALSWKPTDRVSLDLNFVQQDDTLHSEAWVQPMAGPYDQDRPLSFYQPGGFSDRIDLANLVMHYDWDAVSLTAVSAYTKMYRTDGQDISFLGVDQGLPSQLWSLNDTTDDRLLTEEVRLQSHGKDPLQWLIGAFYLDEVRNLKQFVPDYSCPTCVPAVLFGQNFAFEAPLPGQSTDIFNQRQRSLFGEVSYTLAGHWTIGLGGRYLQNELEAKVPASTGLFANGFTPAGPPVGGTNNVFNPSGYLRFKPQDDTTFYFQASRGFRSGTPNQISSFTGACASEAAAAGLRAVSDPDTLWSYELGMKTLFMDNRLQLNVDVFKQHWSGIQLTSDLSCGFNGTINGGDASGYGAEGELTARLSDAWTLNLGTSYAYNKFVSVQPNVGFSAGEQVPGAPERNVTAGAQYSFSLGDRFSGFARADYLYVSDTHYTFGAGDSLIQAPYDTYSLRAGLKRAQLEMDVFSRNVTNKRAVESTGDPLAGGYQYLVPPRQIGIEARYTFR